MAVYVLDACSVDATTLSMTQHSESGVSMLGECLYIVMLSVVALLC